MSYIGNEPEVNAFTIGVDKFNGTGACTQFTLTRSISDVNAIEVVVNGVQQEPTAAYTVSNGVVTFDEAPSSGTNNIIITYRAPVVVTFNQVTQSQIQAGAVGTTQLADGSVTSDKIAQGTVIAADIADGGVTSPKLGLNSVTGNTIGLYAVSGNNIGTGAISANNFAGGGITSNVLASNLSVSLTRASESANINAIGIGGNVNIDVANNAVFYFNANTTANITFNLRANTQNTFDSITTIGQSVTVAMIVKHGTTRHTANLYIDGGLILTGATPFASGTTANALFYAGNTAPNFQSITSAEVNTFGYTILKMAANSYHVIASNTLCKLG